MRSASASQHSTPPTSAAGRGLRPLTLLLVTALWVATVGNLAFWSALGHLPEISGWRGAGFALALALLLAALNVAFFSLFCWRWLLRPVLIITLLIAAATSYFMLSYNVVIDHAMALGVVLTDQREVHDLLSWRLAATLLLVGGLPALAVAWLPLRWPRVPRQLRTNLIVLLAALAVGAALVVAAFPALSSTMRNHKILRYQINPFNTYYALAQLGTRPVPVAGGRVQPLGTDAHILPRPAGARPPLVILVLGETGRSDRFGVNGYARDTTPQLARDGVVSLRNVWSCNTYSAGSIPCMFSPLGRRAFEREKTRSESLVDVLQHAGYGVLWIDNQSGGCKGVCDRVPTVHAAELQAENQCSAREECLDEVMLRGLDARLAALPAAQRARGVVLFLHQIGSHGPDYYKRDPPAFKKFLPECSTNALQQCSAAEIGNAYDNTLLYTDDFLARAITWLQGHEDHWATALSYIADHGESLGEHNLYLHGLPYAVAPDVQKHVPWIFWLSPQFQRQTGITNACLERDRDVKLSHDNYFHTVLGLLGVRTAVYNRSRDITAACRSPDAEHNGLEAAAIRPPGLEPQPATP